MPIAIYNNPKLKSAWLTVTLKEKQQNIVLMLCLSKSTYICYMEIMPSVILSCSI